MRTTLGLPALVLLASCATTSSDDGTSPPTTPPSDPARPAWEVHEWGLVDVVAADGRAEIAAGPGRPGAPGPNTQPIDHPVITRKPVLYVHLGAGVDTLTFRASVTLPNGRVVEHWPSTSLTTNGLTWDGVVATRGACSASSTRDDRPARRGLVACGTEDGYCEVQDLPRYVTSDADCLAVSGTNAMLLFYRGASTNPALPVRATRGEDGRITLTNDTAMAGAPSGVYRITARTEGLTRGRESIMPATTLLTRRARMPPPGSSASLDVAEDAMNVTQLHTALLTDMRALGLTDDEARAFMDAWSDELFVAPHATDVVLYWLTPAAIERVAQLRFEPEPTTVRRAMMVRIDLGPTTAPRMPAP